MTDMEDTISVSDLANILNLRYVTFCKYFQFDLIPFVIAEARGGFGRRVTTETKDILVELREKYKENWYKHLPWPNPKQLLLGSCEKKEKNHHTVKAPKQENMLARFPDVEVATPVKEYSSSPALPQTSLIAGAKRKTNSQAIIQRAKHLHNAGKYEAASHFFMLAEEMSD